MGKPKPPKPPDPAQTAAAQTGTNVSTAVANAYLNNVNQVTPDGALNYNNTGAYDWTDPSTGETYSIPTFTATQTLSEQGQLLKDQGDKAELNMATLAADQSGRLNSLLSSPMEIGNEATEARLYDLGRKRLDPRFSEGREGLATRLSNQGIKLGSEAYDRAMRGFGEQENDAYNQLLLTGRGQATQEQLAERNQPINEITALLSGSQVSQPNFVNSNMGAIPTTDFAGITNQNYNQKLGAWQQQNQNQQQLMGGLFGLGAGAIAASDRRLKKDIEKVGKIDDLNVYRYHYKGEDASTPKHLGVMAQEVKKSNPDAIVMREDGKMAVDYGKALGGA